MSKEQVFQSRFVAYARMHGKTPENMLALDMSRGGMFWFSEWIMGRWAEFHTITERKYRCGAGTTDEGHKVFDKWLDSNCTATPE